ncbi:ADP-ribosylation, partial [Sparassis latifolia]
VDTQFKNAWKHSITVPTVVKVWRIYGSKAINDRFLKYRQDVERRTGLTEGNNRRRWHGTIRACTLGDNDNLRDLCTSQSCSLCQIIRSSFQLARAGQRTNFGRFGAGIYTSATSSKANDYAVNSGGSPYKAMFLNEVVMGKGIKLTRDNVSLTEPPVGYDSVIGEPGGSLNYDESIGTPSINDAIRPMFLVIYRG